MSYVTGNHLIELIRPGADLKRFWELERRKQTKWTEISLCLTGKKGTSRNVAGDSEHSPVSQSPPTVISHFLLVKHEWLGLTHTAGQEGPQRLEPQDRVMMVMRVMRDA